MITLPCTSCQRVLEIDDAFAGGVCRCQHCGTIQTVPAKSKSSTAPAKTLYQKHKSPGAPANGTTATPTRAAQPPAPASSSRRNIAVAIGGAIVLVAAVIVIWLMMRPAA
jgi:hypothetical protein